MATFREMQDRINLDYLNRTDLLQETKRSIIRAVKHYEKTRFWFNQTATALAVGTASLTVAVPADFLALDFVTVLDSSVNSIVNIKSFDRLAYRNQTVAAGGTAASGIPTEVAYFRDILYLDVKPRSATSITVYYTQALATLSADADVNQWTSAGEDLIVHHAAADMLANVLRVTDQDQIKSHKQWEQEAFNNLAAGNDMRMNFGIDNAVIGTIQGQKPKVPGSKLG